jgi:hypothetical protein
VELGYDQLMRRAVRYGGLLLVGLVIGAVLGYGAGAPSLEERKALEDLAKLIKERATLQSLLEERTKQLERTQSELQTVKSDLRTAESVIASLKQEIQMLKVQIPTPSVQVEAKIDKRGFLGDDLLIEVRNITNETLKDVIILVISVSRDGKLMFSPIDGQQNIAVIYPGERAIIKVSPLIQGESYLVIVVTTGGKVHVATAR